MEEFAKRRPNSKYQVVAKKEARSDEFFVAEYGGVTSGDPEFGIENWTVVSGPHPDYWTAVKEAFKRSRDHAK